jgi:hypothetical protein
MTTTDHRLEAHATINPGEHERRVDGTGLQLVRVVLSDDGTVADPTDGSERQRPDVVCALRPADARKLANRLLALADHADRSAVR